MADRGPSILVVDGERDERGRFASLLREAGFAAVAAAEERSAWAALCRERFTAAVIALPEGKGLEFLRRARRLQPDLKALVVVEPAALRLVDADCGTLLKRPFDLRQLLGRVFELVLREEGHVIAPRDAHAAEFGIAAAKLACLRSRRAAAAAAGASRLAQELTRQIGEARAVRRGLAAALTPGGRAAMR